MSFNSCLFAVALRDAGDRMLLERRVSALARFYSRIAKPGIQLEFREELGLLIGSISLGEDPPQAEGLLVWGERLPAPLGQASSLLAADDDRLRQISGQSLAIAADNDRARIVTGCGLVAAAYAAEGPGASAWASHAVAAGFLATGTATFDHERLPELIARKFVGGGRTLIKESSMLPVAYTIDITRSGHSTRTFWTAQERWRKVPPEIAISKAEVALHCSLRERTQGLEPVDVGLTGGLDSRVIALILKEADIPFRTFTWAREGGPDLEPARALSAALGIEHRRLEPVEAEPESAIDTIHAAARWTEGIGAASVIERQWPPGMKAAVVGVGGEIGRAFYYPAGLAKAYPDPSRRQIHRFFDASRAIAGADRRARRFLRSAERAWVEEALRDGVCGWRALDHVYAEQRVRNWGRGMTPLLGTPVVTAFGTTEVAAALTSMPLGMRVRDGFHQAVLSRRPELAPPPAMVTAHPSRLRAASARLPGARFAAHQVRRLQRPHEAAAWGGRRIWAGHAAVRRWVHQTIKDEVVQDVMGRRWSERTADGFSKDLHHPTESALQAAGAVAFFRTLGDLPRLS